MEILTLDAEGVADHLDALAGVLHACVAAGAAVSFVLPFALDDSRAFWRETVLPDTGAGGRLVLAAREEGELIGTVQLLIALPPNQPHRCEVTKLLVHPRHRRRGVGRRLMQELEGAARALGRTLITLDTRSDDVALPLYASLGYAEAGSIPGFALNADGGGYHATTYMYKVL